MRIENHFTADSIEEPPKLCVVLTISVRCPYGDRAIYLRFFQICHIAELNKIVEVTMPINPYDDCRLCLWWPHGKGDLNILWAS